MTDAEAQSPRIEVASCFPTNPAIFKLGERKEHVLAHEIGAGSACRNCQCPGLDLHFWRKICKNCSCRMDEHDVQLPNQYDHGQIVIGRLFGVKEHFESTGNPLDSVILRRTGNREDDHKGSNYNTTGSAFNVRKSEDTVRAVPTAVYSYKVDDGKKDSNTTTEYAWVPIPDKILVEKYMRALPEEERPIAGTVGEQNRKSRLQFQLPLYDCNVDDARFASEQDKEVLGRFVENVKKNVIGVGTVVEVDERSAQTSPTKSITESVRQTLEKATIGKHKKECQGCTKPIPEGDVGIETDHGPSDDTWHPNCFRCAHCDQLLVDIIYFYHEGKYYCGRHFADLQYPRCSGCDELIFANEYTFAEEKSWHFDHFACFKCDLKLGGHRYMTKEDQPHCIPCYIEHYAKSCEACRKKIGPDEKRLNYKEFHWHASEECFKCDQCGKGLIGQKFMKKNENLFCSSNCKTEYSR